MKVAIAGAGAWGTALAAAMTRDGAAVPLWGRDDAIISEINADRHNGRYLDGVTLPALIRATNSAEQAFDGAEAILLAIPAQILRPVLAGIGVAFPAGAVLISCAKGIERGSNALMTDVIGTVMPGHRAAVLSGPSFAADVASGLPTAVTLAMDDEQHALALCEGLSRSGLRLYASGDPTGVEYGGALKNVLAIAAGIVDGRGLGASAKAALIARGFAEMCRVAETLGAQPATLGGLSGLGDLILTCGSAQSRNFAYGQAIGRSASLRQMKLAEGVATAGVAAHIAKERGIEAPIIAAVAAIVDGRLDVDDAIATLLARPIKHEQG